MPGRSLSGWAPSEPVQKHRPFEGAGTRSNNVAKSASVLAMLVGQVMLIVRADRTPENELAAAVNLLDGCEHIQLVLNSVAFVSGSQRFGSYYGQEGAR